MGKLTTRRASLGLLAASFCLTCPAQAQTYPTKPITFVVPYPAGGGADIVARVLAEKMGPKLGQNIIVDNKAGAGGILGTDAVAKAPPDGHTLVVAITSSLLINQFLFKKQLPYDPQKDLAMVSQIALGALMLVVNPAVPANNVDELKSYVAANRGKLSYGSYGIGSASHLGGAQLSKALSGDLSHVPYKGAAQMIQDLASGQIPLAFSTVPDAKALVDAGKLRLIGITGEKRMSAYPNVPTLAEQGLTDEVFRIVGWIAIAAPAATPKAVQQRIADEVRAAVQLPDVKARFEGLGLEIVARGPEEFGAVYKRDAPGWEKAVKDSGATLD